MSADPALSLTIAYLRLNGYFLVTEQELHVKEPTGYRTLTDIDVIALRPPTAPGPRHHHLGQAVAECLVVTDVDEQLDVDPNRFDVIVGEVKTGQAEMNAALRTPGALHAALRRTGDIYDAPLDNVVDDLIGVGSATTETARARLAAFAGHGHVAHGATIHLDDMAGFIRGHLHAHRELYRVTQFSDPAVALIELLEKIR